MKKPVKTLFAVGIALILISGVAYAADKKKKAKQPGFPADPSADDEAVKAELLAAVEGQKAKVPRKSEATAKVKEQPAAEAAQTATGGPQ